ncbi:alpha/beta fold hydrolase [Nocardia sp. NPDC020380]|uniref:alpha/beta fold hydrolase n=1 Tax=Nocardia sp. NPDC020380 TaxID=3364309 RepID=UPI0037A0E9AE
MPTYQSPSDGTTLAYQDYGTGTPIVFVAGWSLYSDMWEYQLHYFLEQGYRCILPDRRGHGRSDIPSGGYDIDTRADDLAALIDLLDLRDVTLVAHSTGGGEVVRYLNRHGSERITRTALLAPAIPFMLQTEDNPVGVPPALAEETLRQLRTDRPQWFADRAQGYFATHLRPGTSQAMIDEEMKRCLSTPPHVALTVQREALMTDYRADVAALRIPTLILHGLVDQSIPIELSSHQAVKLAPHIVLKEYWDAGHGLYLTHQDEMNSEIHAFIKG